MLYFIFTIDGDWEEYFDVNLSEGDRVPKIDSLQSLILKEIEVAERNLNGRFIHFIHTSPRVRDFFLKERFLELWDRIVKNGGDVGLHCHEDDPYKDYYCQDTRRMKEVISREVCRFREAGLSIKAYRGGFLGFSHETVRILEENRIYFDFSCEHGRYLRHGDILISDWRNSPEHHYRMSYKNHCDAGDSKVWEVPIGSSKKRHLYFEKASLEDLRKVALDLKERSIQNKCDIIVSVLTHTYEYASLEGIKKIEEKISLLKQYADFINLQELERIIS